MNIDQRLEALTQSVELLAAIERDSEKRIEARFTKLIENMDRLAQATTRLDEGMLRMANILMNHEERIENLEGKRPQ